MLWRSLCKLVEPHYPKPGHGRRPVGPEAVVRAPLCLRAFVARRGGQGYPLYEEDQLLLITSITTGPAVIIDGSRLRWQIQVSPGANGRFS